MLELEKEAEEYAKENYCYEVRATARNAYLDCARLKGKRIAELEAQIEKMKCCENCNNYCHRIDHRCNTKCKNLSEWEIKEK